MFVPLVVLALARMVHIEIFVSNTVFLPLNMHVFA